MQDNSLSVDELSELDEVYLPFMVVYHDLKTTEDHALLVFAVSAPDAGDVANEFMECTGVDGMILSINLVNVQATIVQKADPCPTNGTDELDDPIRKS